ncbi:DUF418 domain-containing protein, partial [Georgenia sp. 10Sc9-8]|nr:DUF418 domain-containing protein [Georgenia halotolerans]
VLRRGRVRAIDAARALAIIGMLAVNVGPKESPGLWGRLYLVPHGRASLLFVLLAGIGVSLLSRRARDRSGTGAGRHRLTLLWRAALLLLAGLALQLLDHDVNVILATYALLFVVAGLLLRAPDRLLLTGAAAVAVVGPLVLLGSQLASGTGYDHEPAALGDPPGDVLHSLVISGAYPLVTWLAPFLFGMWLGRQDLTDRRHQVLMVTVGGLVAALAPVLSRVATALVGDPGPGIGPRLLVTGAAHGQMPLWLVGGTASAVAVLGVCLLLSHLMDSWLWPLVATGQLALTVYVAHLLALHVLRPAPHSLAQGVLITVGMTVAAVALATWWRSRFARGPLEVLLRPPWTVTGS